MNLCPWQLVQAATNILYKIFFKVAPALAGSQETGGASNVRNEQLIDMDSSSVNNIVDVSLPGLSSTLGLSDLWSCCQHHYQCFLMRGYVK